MKSLLILLAIGSIAIAKPPVAKKAAEPLPVVDAFDIRSISKEDILATIRHKNAIIAEQKVELDSAKSDVETFRAKAEDADTQVVSAQGETAVIQKSMDDLRAWGLDQEKQKQEAQIQVDKDAVKIARFGKLVLVISFLLAAAAALYVFEMLKPAGILGKLLSVTGPGVQYGAPIVVFLAVFSAVQVYLRYFL